MVSLLLHCESGMPGLLQKYTRVLLTTLPAKLQVYVSLSSGQSSLLMHSPVEMVVVVVVVVVLVVVV